MTGTAFELDTAASVLGFARERRTVADRAEADLLQAAVAWAGMHSVDSIHEAATVSDGRCGDTAITVAGPGAPLVAEFSVAEFAAAIGLPTEVGKSYVGEAVELRYRLPRLWARVTAGDLAAWRARRIARATLLLSLDAAAFVDQHVAHVAHRIRVGQLD
ncbi:MAG TPA: HNH endonuclease, partial [Nocardioides sp.]|nr:HNH endonuclease [Nocardioides sp.]